jgi:hypothetical protein
VSVPWETVRSAVTDFIAACGVVSADHVSWEHEATPIVHGDVIELRIGAESAVGFDDVAEVEQDDGRAVPRVTGWREFTLSIRYNSRSTVTGARASLERIRASLHHPARLAILSDAGVSFLGTEMLQAFNAVAEDRWEAVAVLDVRLGVVSELYEPDIDITGTEHLAEVGVNDLIYPLEE